MMAGMANSSFRNSLLIYLGIILLGIICAFRFTIHPLPWILSLIAAMPVLSGIFLAIIKAVKVKLRLNPVIAKSAYRSVR